MPYRVATAAVVLTTPGDVDDRSFVGRPTTPSSPLFGYSGPLPTGTVGIIIRGGTNCTISTFRPYQFEDEYGEVTAESSDLDSSESEVNGYETVTPLCLNGSGSRRRGDVTVGTERRHDRGSSV
uniref:Uncharacterized protein n=1 Tax=Sipha flava TaxID=143950 RepID=A0A2S2QWY9_9HEMI